MPPVITNSRTRSAVFIDAYSWSLRVLQGTQNVKLGLRVPARRAYRRSRISSQQVLCPSFYATYEF